MTNHRRPLRAAAAALTAVAGLVAPMLLTTLPAQAVSALQYGKVVFVDDGDTIDVDVKGDGTSKPVRVRFIGIQAMELHVYSHTLSKLRGECWGVDAAKNLHRLVAGKQVRLTARKESSASTHNVRPRRFVAVQVNGVWTDVGAMQLDAGLVLPDLIPDEFSHNLDYARRAQSAAELLTQQFGVPSENLTSQGYGEQYLKEQTQGPSLINRRVTIRNITPLLNGGQASLPPPPPGTTPPR